MIFFFFFFFFSSAFSSRRPDYNSQKARNFFKLMANDSQMPVITWTAAQQSVSTNTSAYDVLLNYGK